MPGQAALVAALVATLVEKATAPATMVLVRIRPACT